jgi:hypothetical protein
MKGEVNDLKTNFRCGYFTFKALNKQLSIMRIPGLSLTFQI